MANGAKYQVFISSTYEDLKEERDQVIRAVLEMGHIPVGMEMFSAADEEQWQIIARHIEQSDYYAVVVAHRLGSLTSEGISYTRKEYEYAVSMGVPILGFLLEEKAPWPADRVDSSTGTKRALDDFRTLIRSKPVSFWTSTEDLYGRFSVALMKAFTANPRDGWIRASSAGSGPEVTAEVVRLSSENAALRRQLAEAKDASGKEQMEQIIKTLKTLFAAKRKPAYRYTTLEDWLTDSEITLFDVFHKLSREMIVDASVISLASTLAMEIRLDKTKRWHTVAHNQVRNLLAELMTLDLVEPSSRKHAVSDTNEYWTLSKFGNQVLKYVLKTSLAESESLSPPETDSGAETPTAMDSKTDQDATV